MGGTRRALGLSASLALAVALCIALGGRAAARSIDVAPAPAPASCDPCPLSRTIVDQPAWDETVTVTDQAAWDETITVVDTPASTAYRTIVDSPAHSVAHHDLVSPARTVARQVLTAPAHEESYQLWVSSGYWTQHWIDTSHYVTQTVWVTSGYSQPYWQDTSHSETRPLYVSQGYSYTYWVDTGGYYACSGGGEDRECIYYGSGYYASSWVDTSYWSEQSVWVSSGYWTSYWVNTSHYEYPQVWVASGYYQQQWIDTGGYWATGYTPRTCEGSAEDRDCWGGDPYSYWQPTGYYTTSFWVDTSHTETRTRHVDDVFSTLYDQIPAVYSDWIEPVAAVTHQEAYTVPAVTHTTTVHHDALTHTAVVHHAAVTHEEPITADQLTTQNRQSATASTSSTVSGTDGTTTPPSTTIPVVSTITIVDKAASTTTRTVVDRAAYDETRTVIDSPARDETVSTPLYGWVDHCSGGPDGDCVSNYELIGYATWTVHHDAVTHSATVHHDAVTHSETVSVPAVTHHETMNFDARVANGASPGEAPADPVNTLLELGVLMGLSALAGAGRLSPMDTVRTAVAEWSQTGRTLPFELMPAVEDGQVSDAEAAAIAEAVTNAAAKAVGDQTADTAPDDATLDPGCVSASNDQPRDTPPSAAETAVARAQFEAALRDRARPSDPFGGLSFIPDALGWLGDRAKPMVRDVTSAVLDAPVVGGVVHGGLDVLSFVNDSLFETPAGTVALLADAGLETGLRERVAHRMAAEGRPFWEAPKIASEELGKALTQISEDPSVPTELRVIAQGARVTEFVAEAVGGGELAVGALARTERAFARFDAAMSDALDFELSLTTMDGTRVGERTFRVWGEDPETGLGSRQWGRSWTDRDPAMMDDAPADLGLPAENTGRYVNEGILIDDQGVVVKTADPIFDANGEMLQPGGGPELVIPDAEAQVRLVEVYDAMLDVHYTTDAGLDFVPVLTE